MGVCWCDHHLVSPLAAPSPTANTTSTILDFFWLKSSHISDQCFDSVGWAAGRASGL